MTAADIADLLGAQAVVDQSFGQLTADVPAEAWAEAAAALLAAGYGFFDWLSAYDDTDAGLAVVVHVWSIETKQSVKLRTRVSRDGGHLPSLTSVWPGANWHERETYEMFAIGFDGHPNLVPLLLPDGFEGNPLRKEFVLASRVAKAWPGEKEPGESDGDLRRAGKAEGGGSEGGRQRRRMLPPGVPEPGQWGPQP